MTERTSYLSAAEVEAAQSLHRRGPYSITGVSQSMFSVSRHFPGCTEYSCRYTYLPEHDELVRDDVLAMVEKMRTDAAQFAKHAAPVAVQDRLDLGDA